MWFYFDSHLGFLILALKINSALYIFECIPLLEYVTLAMCCIVMLVVGYETNILRYNSNYASPFYDIVLFLPLNGIHEVIFCYLDLTMTGNFCQRTKRNPSNGLHIKGHFSFNRAERLYSLIPICMNALPVYVYWCHDFSDPWTWYLCWHSSWRCHEKRYLWGSEKEIDYR